MLPIRPLASSLCLLALLALPGLAPAEGNGADFLRSNPRFLSAFRKIVAGVSPSVVRIRCDERDTALGFVVGADGWILTKAHDLKGRITCRLGDERELEATLVGVSEQHDLALLRIAAQGLPPLALADNKAVQAGNWVVSVGMGRDPVAIGVVSVPTRDVAKGKAASAKAPYLGVALSSNEAGVHITEVLAGTAAARAGLQSGDVILQIDGTPVSEPDEFIAHLARHRPGDTITLRIVRAGEEMDIRATLQSRPRAPRADMQNRMGSELSSRRTGYPIILQHDSVLKPSDCGSPLVDLEGRVLGINISRAGRVESWAIPTEVIRPLLADLKAGKGAPPRSDE
jgi:serine protease Do